MHLNLEEHLGGQCMFCDPIYFKGIYFKLWLQLTIVRSYLSSLSITYLLPRFKDCTIGIFLTLIPALYVSYYPVGVHIVFQTMISY